MTSLNIDVNFLIMKYGGNIIIILLASLLTVFITAVSAESFNLFHSKKHCIIVTLKNEADINKAKNKISEIPQIKIINIQYRDKEWSKMVNKMDLPRMENPFKNEFTVKINKKANMKEIYDLIKEMDFVENVEYAYDRT